VYEVCDIDPKSSEIEGGTTEIMSEKFGPVTS
jgi:hypothetical protein